MSEDVFRIFIAIAVGLACLAFVVQAFVGAAMLRVARAIQKKLEDLAGKAEPLMAGGGAAIEKIGPLLEKAGPVIEQAGPAIAKIGPAVEKFGPVADKLALMLDSGHQLVEETRPRLAEISAEAQGIAREGRKQVERLGGLLADAGERARTRLEQIDQTVETTVETIGSVKRAVTRPAREVSGLAAALAAVIAALAKGQRRPTVDSATQDEEMFI